MNKKKVIVKRHSINFIIYSIIFLFFLLCFVTYYFILGPVRQCGLCGPQEPKEFSLALLNLLIGSIILLGGVIILFVSPFLRGLNEQERIILKYIFKLKNKKMKRYGLRKILKKNEEAFNETDKRQIYRVVERLVRWGLVNKKQDNTFVVTSIGMKFIQLDKD